MTKLKDLQEIEGTPTFVMRNMSMNGMEFEISGKKVIINDVETLVDIADNIYDYCDFNLKVSELLEKYQLIESDIDEYLEKCVIKRDDEFYYDVGEDFAYVCEDINPNEQIFDNNISIKRIEEEYNKFTNNKHNLFFEADPGFCHVYTTDKKDAKLFLKFSLEKWIIPFINDL